MEKVVATTQARVMFMTTGILLRRLSSGGGGLEGVVHVVIDEVRVDTLSPSPLVKQNDSLTSLCAGVQLGTLLHATSRDSVADVDLLAVTAFSACTVTKHTQRQKCHSPH
jgi:hypothetical protein